MAGTDGRLAVPQLRTAVPALAAALCLAAALVLGVGPAASGQEAPADGSSVTADKEGWWNRLRGIEEEAGPNPLGGTVAAPAPPTDVPAGAIAVGAEVGEADAVAAIGITLPVGSGATVERLVMTLALAGAGQSGEPSGIRACPVTAFFVPEENGEFQNRPAADCEAASVAGTRADDGSWTFDLTPIARLWVDPAGTIAQDGVLLEPVAEGPASFQVAFSGAPDGVTFDFAGAPGADGGDAFGAPATGGSASGSSGGGSGGFAAPGPSAGSSGGSFGGSSGGSFGGSAGGSSGSFGGATSSGAPGGLTTSPAPVVAPDSPGTEVAAPPPASPVVAAAPESIASATEVGNTFGNVPMAAWLALVLGIGLAVLTASTLGPGTAPEAAIRRTGGVSRALAQRAAHRPR